MIPQPLEVHTQSGIGDISWIYSKLVTTNRPLTIVYHTGHNMTPTIAHRCVPLLQMLPNVQTYHAAADLKKLLNATNPVSANDVATASVIYCAANTHLETGKRIENFIGDMPTDHHYTLNIPATDIQHAKKLIGKHKNYCLLYVSSVIANKRWNKWSNKHWCELIHQYRKRVAAKPIILIGAPWDKDLAAQLVIPNMRNYVGQTTLGTALALIKYSTHFIAFPSGLSIMACQLNKPVLMFYPRFLRGLHNSWPPADMLADHSYIASPWVSPPAVMERVAAYWDAAGAIFRNIKVTTSCRPIRVS